MLDREPCSGARSGSPSAADEVGHAARDRWPARPDHARHRHRADEALGCRDASGRANSVRTSVCSTISPAYMTATRSHISATTPRSWVIRMMAVPVSRWRRAHQVEDLGLDGHVERGRRLVGDEQLGLAGERHRDHHALRHAARHLVRDRPRAGARVGDADHRACSSSARSARRLALHAAVELEDLADLVADVA